MVFLNTFMTIRAIQKTRRDARHSYQLYQKKMQRQVSHEWLKARTLHIRGIPQEDRSGDGLKLVI